MSDQDRKQEQDGSEAERADSATAAEASAETAPAVAAAEDAPATGAAEPEATSDPEPASGTASAPAAAELAGLEDRLAALAGVERARVGRFPQGDALEAQTGTVLVALRLGELDRRGRAALSSQAQALVRATGRVAIPVLLDGPEWQALEQAGAGDVLALLAPRRRHLQRFAQLRARPDHPATARRWLLRVLGQHRDAINTVVSTTVVPEPVAVDICLAVLRDSLELIFASAGEVFTADHDAYAVLERAFADASELGAADLDLYFDLLGLREQVAERRAAPRPRRHASSLGAPVKRLRDLLGRLERYVDRTLSTERTRAARRRLRGLALAGVGLGLVLVAVGIWAYLRPEGPRSTPADPGLAGGIETIYFKGKDLKNEVARRVSPGIHLNTRGAPIAELEADRFSIRWQGFVHIDKAGKQVLCAESDDGKRVYFNDALLIDDWKNHRKQRHCKDIRVQQGWYPLRFDYFESGGAAEARLLLGPDREKVADVPAKRLCCGKVGETPKK